MVVPAGCLKRNTPLQMHGTCVYNEASADSLRSQVDAACRQVFLSDTLCMYTSSHANPMLPNQHIASNQLVTGGSRGITYITFS